MPNDIYKGENVGGDHVYGVPSRLWGGSYLWQKSAYNNHYNKDNDIPLDNMLSRMYNNDFDVVSVDDFALFSVFMSLTNSYHYGSTHNWRLYYDAYYEKMFPIVWDPMGWWKGFSRFNNIDIFRVDPMQLMAQDYRFLNARQNFFYKFYTSQYENFKKTSQKRDFEFRH